jgi:glycosyltransferase involved in cell wall biosynthesis
LQQSVAPREILVVDDGSTDDSVVLIEAYRRRCDRIRLIRHTANQGAFAAVPTGIAAASGEFLLFAAADDFILPDLIVRAVEAFRANPQAAFFCSLPQSCSPAMASTWSRRSSLMSACEDRR